MYMSCISGLLRFGFVGSPQIHPGVPSMQPKQNETKTKKKDKVRYAIVGLGYIAQIAVLPAFAHATENSELTALVSSDPKKLKELSRKYGVEHTYSYEQYA